MKKIIYVLISDIKWKYLESYVHFTIIYKCKIGIFQEAHNKLIEHINKKIKDKIIKVNLLYPYKKNQRKNHIKHIKLIDTK